MLQNITTGSSLSRNTINSNNSVTDGTGSVRRPVQQKSSSKSSDSSSSYHGSEVQESTDIKVLHRLIADLQYDGCINLKINIIAGLFLLAARCSRFGRFVHFKSVHSAIARSSFNRIHFNLVQFIVDWYGYQDSTQTLQRRANPVQSFTICFHHQKQSLVMKC